MCSRAVVLFLFLPALYARSADFPLEALQLSGTVVRPEAVLGITGLKIGAPVNKSTMESACDKLQQTGLFASVEYSYAPGPKHGYILTLVVTDPPKFLDAALDVEPAAAEQTWNWLKAQYPRLDHRVPENGAAQQFIASEMERHLGTSLAGEKLTTRLEADLERGTTLVAFQPEHLPAVRTLTFKGLRAVDAEELSPVLRKALGDNGYTPRSFHSCLESSLKPVFEHHGLYKSRFVDVQLQNAGPQVLDVSTTVEEGPTFVLGNVRLLGDDLPVEAMRKAADFKPGKLADWTQIQLGIYQSEARLKRTGYIAARSTFERILHEDTHSVDVDVTYKRGPLFHFGVITFTGLNSADEARARKMWKPAPGAPYDPVYGVEFQGEFSRTLDGRLYKSLDEKTKPGAGDHTIDVELIFIRR